MPSAVVSGHSVFLPVHSRRPVTRTVPNHPRRPPLTSVCTAGPLPTFAATSNPELDTLISMIRDELFIPSHLSQRYNTLQRRKRNHYVLDEEPLTVDVSGVPVTLKPKMTQTPVPVKLFTRALGLMQKPSDLDAIPGLVLGFAQAKRRIKEEQAEKLARLCNAHGRTDILMKLAHGAGDNGFLFTRPAAREFIRGLRMVGMLPDKKTNLKAVKDAEALINYLGEPLMRVGRGERLGRDPVVVGTMLSIVAGAAKKWNEGEDYNQKTRQWVHKLQACWKDVEWQPNLGAKKTGDRSPVHRAKNAVLDYLPVLEGLITARDMLRGTDQSAWLESQSAKLNDTVAEWKKFLDENFVGEQLWNVSAYKKVAEKLAQEKEWEGKNRAENEVGG